MTQEQLAECLGVSRQAVGKWESGRAKPTAEKQARLSEILGISPEAWTAAAAEEEAAREAPVVRSARRWRRWTAVLAVLLCLSLTAQGVTLWYFLRTPAAAEGETAEQRSDSLPADTSYMFPERLELSAEPVEHFGDWTLLPETGLPFWRRGRKRRRPCSWSSFPIPPG